MTISKREYTLIMGGGVAVQEMRLQVDVWHDSDAGLLGSDNKAVLECKDRMAHYYPTYWRGDIFDGDRFVATMRSAVTVTCSRQVRPDGDKR